MKLILISSLTILSIALFSQTDDNNFQISEYRKSFNYFKQQNDVQKAGSLSAEIALIYWNNGESDSALYYFLIAADYFKKLNDHNSLVLIYTNIGVIYQSDKYYSKTIGVFKKALSESEKTDDLMLIAIKRLDLASAYSMNNDFNNAEELYYQALKIGKDNNNNDIILSTLDKMHQMYQKSGNEMMANEFVIRYNHYADSVEGAHYDLHSLLEKNRQKYAKPELKESDIALARKDSKESTTKDLKKIRKEKSLTLKDKKSEEIIVKLFDSSKEKIYSKPDVMPKFPGGKFSLKLYLANILPSSSASIKKEKLEVEFIINKYGFLLNPSIKKGINSTIDNEVINAMNILPTWIPGQVNDQNENVKMSIDINYPFENIQILIEQEIERLLKNKEVILNSNDQDSITNFYIELGNLYYYSRKNEQAFEYYSIALELSQKNNNRKSESDILANIANIYHSWVRFIETVDYYSMSIEIKEQINDSLSQGKTLYKLGNVYLDMGDTVKALDSYEKSLAIDSLMNNKHDKAVAFNNLGVLYFSRGELNKALKYYLNALKIYSEMQNKFGSATTLNNIGNVHFELEMYNEALKSYNNSLHLKEEINYLEGIAIALFNIGNVHKKINNHVKAIDYFLKCIELCKQFTFNKVEWKCYQALAEVFAGQNDCGNVLKYHRLYSKLRFFTPDVEEGKPISEYQVKYINQYSFSSELIQRIDQLQQSNFAKDLEINNYLEKIREQKLIARLEAQKQQQQIALLNTEKELQEREIERKNIQRNILVASLLIVLVILSVIYYFLKKNKKLNTVLKTQKNEILEKNTLLKEQKDQIERDADEIKGSIYYAQYIQSATLPQMEKRTEYLGEHFVMYEPKDIVSGDFYWVAKVEERVVVAIADCTGHGVPGAFMSMLGSSFLNEIVNKEYITHTGVILRRLRKEVINALKQSERNDRRDGMDISICSIDFENLQLQFSGANNPLYIIRDNKNIEIDIATKCENNKGVIYNIKGDNMPIGYYQRMDKFSDHEIKLEKGDCIYMFTDGYADQFGGQRGKKFMYKNFKELLLNIYKLPCSEQKKILHQRFITWKGDESQIDDVLVFGMKIK
ncbi:tetratricopeptide repeat protein [Bacteroidota bacterium]